MSQNFEELYNKLKQEFELSKKDNDDICKEYEATIEMLSDSVESFKEEKASLEQKISKYEQDFKSIKKEKESLLNKNKDKNSDIQNLNKQNDRLSNEVKKLNEEKALFDTKIVSLENDNEHFQNKIREYEALVEDLENQLESALEENITLQTEFETYKQTTGEQLLRKDDEIRDIKNDLLNKDKFIQRLQARANNGLLVKNIQKNFMENKTKERRRLTLFPGMPGEESDLIKFQKNLFKNNLEYDCSSEKTKSNINDKNKMGSVNEDNKSRGSIFMPGLGSLSRLKNKKEELSKNNKDLNSQKKKESKFSYLKGKENNSNNTNKNSKKNIFSEKNKLSPQIEEISESSENEENKKIKMDFIICKEKQLEYINANIKGKDINKNKVEKHVIVGDLEKILANIRKRKEKLLNSKRINKERIKSLKLN